MGWPCTPPRGTLIRGLGVRDPPRHKLVVGKGI